MTEQSNDIADEQEELSIEVLFELYADQLYRYAHRKVRDKSTAEDLVQEAFLGAVRSKKSYQGRSEPKYWLLAILKNKIADHYKRIERRKEALPIVDSDNIDDFFGAVCWSKGNGPKCWNANPEEIALQKGFAAVVDRCISELPEKLRDVFAQKVINERTPQELQEATGLSTGNIRVVLHRARIMLRACVEQGWLKVT